MPEIEPDVMIFQVDFNNMDENRLVKGSFAHALSDRLPVMDERVILRDDEGNACWATVARLGQRTLRFDLALETWTSGEELSATGVPAAEGPALSWSPELAAA